MEYINSLFNKHIDLISKSTTIQTFEKRYDDANKWLFWLKNNSKISLKDFDLFKSYLNNLSFKYAYPTSINHTTLNSKQFKLILIVLFFLFILLCGLLLTTNYYKKNLNSHLSTSNLNNREPSSIFFEGTFTNNDGTAVTSSSDLYFSLYVNEDDTEPFYTGACVGNSALMPDYDGTFTVLLGEDCNMTPIPAEQLAENSYVWLGVRVSNDPELKPRKRLFTSVGDADARSLSGMERGTTNSTVLYLDDKGELVLDSKSPSIKSTDGIFTIRGDGLMLESTNPTTGTIFIQPAGGSNTIISSGNLGVGTFDPQVRLSVVGTEPYSSVASIRNISPVSNTSSVLELGIGESTENTNSTFVNFYSGASQIERGVKVGSISLNNGRVAYETSGADFAEYFKYDGDASIEPGMIIGISPDGIAPAVVDMTIIGVVSATPGFVGNAQSTPIYNNTYTLIGLVGQVDVLVTTENGTIEVGDEIILSNYTQGYGAKYIRGNIDKVGIVIDNENLKSFKLCSEALKTPKGTLCGKVKMLIRID